MRKIRRKGFIAWILSVVLIAGMMCNGCFFSTVSAEGETALDSEEAVSAKTMDKDILMAVTPNSPYSVKNITDKLDVQTALAGQSVNVNTTYIDPTDLSNWYVYDHYDVDYYTSGDAAIVANNEIEKLWEEQTGYNKNLRPYYPYKPQNCHNDGIYTIEEIEKKDKTNDIGNVYKLKEHIAAVSEDGKAAMKFYGYDVNGYSDFLFYPAGKSGTKKVEYTIDAKDVKPHSLKNAGFLFNCGVADGKLTGYAMVFAYQTDSGDIADQQMLATGIDYVRLYKLDNVEIEDLHSVSAGMSSYLAAGGQGVTSLKSQSLKELAFEGHFDISNIELSITDTSVKATITEAGEQVTETPDTVTLFDIQGTDFKKENYNGGFTSTAYGGFGPIITYGSHGCSWTSSYKYSNLKMSITESDSILSGLSDADYILCKDKGGEYIENDKYYVLIGDKTKGEEGYKDFFKRDFDDVYLEMLKNQHVILVTNLNIKGSSEIDGTDYNLEDYLGEGNVIQLEGETADELADELEQIFQTATYSSEAATAAKDALDSETGTGHQKAAATLKVLYNDYQVGEVNTNRLPQEGVILNLDTTGSIGVTNPVYSLKKPDGTVVSLDNEEIKLLPTDDLMPGEYTAMVWFDEGVEASSKFNISAYHNSYFNNVLSNEGADYDGLHFTVGTVGINKVLEGKDYKLVLHPDAGYELPSQLYVKVDEESYGTSFDESGDIWNKDGDKVEPVLLERDKDYTYNSDNGEVTVKQEAITGNLYFYADTSKVTYQLTDMMVSGDAKTTCSLYDDEDFSVTLVASGDAVMPKNIQVTIGEQVLPLSDPATAKVSDKEVSYENGTLIIDKALLKDDIVVTAAAVWHDITYELTNMESSNTQASVDPYMDYKTTLTPMEDYELPESIIVAVDGVEINQYTYDKTTGELVIDKEALTGDVLIVAEAKKKPPVIIEPAKEYSVTYHLTNLTTTGADKADSENDYVTTLVAAENYRLPGDFIITVAGKTLKAGEDYGYDGTKGIITIPKSRITGDIVITAVGVVFEQTSQPKPDTSKLVVIPPKYEDSKDGKIIGVSLDMEYSVDNGKTWTKCSSNTIKNLGVGTVKLRFYETDLKKSSPIANIEIESSTAEYYIPTIYMTKKMGLNQKFQLKLKNTKGAAVKYKSSNTKLVTVNKKGVITSRKKTGKAKVVISLIKGKHIVQYVAKVTVDKKVKKNYSLAKFNTKYKSPTIAFYKNVGKDKKWKIKLTHTKNANITFKSSDESVAIVDKKGKVTGVSSGKAIVTIKVDNQGVIDKYFAVIRVVDESVPSDVSYLKVLK